VEYFADYPPAPQKTLLFFSDKTKKRFFTKVKEKERKELDKNEMLWDSCQAACEAMKIKKAKEFLDLILNSERVWIDLLSFINFKNENNSKKFLYIAVRKWKTFPIWAEFRCFIYSQKLTAISQYFHFIHFPQLAQSKNLRKLFKSKIILFYERVLKLKIDRLVQQNPKFKNIVLDLVFLGHKVVVIESNPFGRKTGAGLFHWVNDKNIITGEQNKDKKENHVSFRIRKEARKDYEGVTLLPTGYDDVLMMGLNASKRKEFLKSICGNSKKIDNINKKVILLGIDGVRADSLLFANIPNIRSLLSCGGKYSFYAKTGKVTMSAPQWASVFTGISEQTHQYLSEIKSINKPQNITKCKTVFHYLRENKKTSQCIYGWPKMSDIIRFFDNTIENVVDTFDVNKLRSDKIGVNKICEKLQQKCVNEDLFFIHLDSIDSAGHRSGYSLHSTHYLNAIQEVDKLIGTLVQALHSRKNILDKNEQEEWLLVLTSDHGGCTQKDMPVELLTSFVDVHGFESDVNDKGFHGFELIQHTNVFLILAVVSINEKQNKNKKRKMREILPAPSTLDIAPTILKWLNVEIDKNWNIEGNIIKI